VFDVLPPKLESPPYTVVIAFVPTGSVEVVKLAEPPLSVPVPSTVVPFINETVSPFGGAPTLEVTAATKDHRLPTTVQSVTLADTAPGVTICYTTNGSSPAVSTAGVCTAGLTYSSSSPIPVSTSTTIYAVAGGNGYACSSLVRAIYTID